MTKNSKNVSELERMSTVPWKTSRFGIKEVQFVQENYFYTYSHLLFVAIVYLNCVLEMRNTVKKYLKDIGYEVEDFGFGERGVCDYPDYASISFFI